MLKEKHSLLRRIQLSLDLASTVASFFLAYFLRHSATLSLAPLSPISHYLFLLYIVLPLWAVLLYGNKAYSPIRTLAIGHVLLPPVKTVFLGGIILMSSLFIFKIQAISRTLIFLFLILNAVLLMGERLSLYVFLHNIRKRGLNYRGILIVGTGLRAQRLAALIQHHKEWGLRILGFLDRDVSLVGRKLDSGTVIGTLDGIQEALTAMPVDEVIFVVPRKWLDKIEKAVLVCEQMGRKASIAADFYAHEIAHTKMEKLREWSFLSFNPISRLDEVAATKRIVDIAVSAVVLVLAGPLLLAISLGIKLTSEGPVFFKQKRCGLNGREFSMLKFRTMVDNAELLKRELAHLNEMSGPVFKIKEDPRITAIGRLLRRYSLDELPQFINVLKGDMSIVGPRPPIPSEVEGYDIWQRRRLSVRPGLTCLWQVGGRNNVDFDEWARLDLEYIDNLSLSLDFKIILKTIPAVFMGTGV
ncbi:sugar transferase [Candidatus Poribacteria bacterium]|nr:sugar transferase [Candidatus Poribacteria bacterium]